MPRFPKDSGKFALAHIMPEIAPYAANPYIPEVISMNDSATTSNHAAHVARRRDPCPKGDPDAPRADQRDTTQRGEHGPRGRDALTIRPRLVWE